MSENRQAFERFISSPPFERDIKRFPTDGDKYPWPGAYRSITVELAWECWKEATSMQIARFESQLAEAEARLAETEKALRWVCDVYIVGHYYSDDQREEQLERTTRRVMVKANVGEEE